MAAATRANARRRRRDSPEIILNGRTFAIGKDDDIEKVESKVWTEGIVRQVPARGTGQKFSPGFFNTSKSKKPKVQRASKTVKINENANVYREISNEAARNNPHITPLGAYHDNVVDIDTFEENQPDPDQWDPESNHERAADRHIRNYITNCSVSRHVYRIGDVDDVEVTDQERLILYKWTEAVMLEITVAQAIAGAATMLSMDQVMVPVYNAIPTGNEIITYDVLKKSAEKLLEMQMNPLKEHIKEYNENPQAYKQKVVNIVQQNRNNRGNMYYPGVTNIDTFDINGVDAWKNVNVDFDMEIAQKGVFNVQYLRSLAEQYVKAQKRLRTLSPIAWNALDDTFNMVEDVLAQQNLNIEKYICKDPRKMQASFKLSRKEFITFISRHPLLHTHICKAAGANLQSTLNLRDGSYSSLRKYNANDSRTLVYLFRTKHEVRKSALELEELLKDVISKPMLYLEYFMDTTKGIQQSGFQKWLVVDENSQFPGQLGNIAPALPDARNHNIFRDINIFGSSMTNSSASEQQEAEKLINTVTSNAPDVGSDNEDRRDKVL
eukprot:758861-Hanusia_phi.AAC.1